MAWRGAKALGDPACQQFEMKGSDEAVRSKMSDYFASVGAGWLLLWL
jgi:hypothetical protein